MNNILGALAINALGLVNLKFMNRWERLLAFRLLQVRSQSFSKNMMILAISAVALSVSVMIITVSSVKGFQNGIKNKVIRLHGDFIIDDAGNSENAEPKPFSKWLPNGKNIEDVLDGISGIESIQKINSKACIIKSDTELDGVVANGMKETDFLHSFQSYLIQKENGVQNVDTVSSSWIYISKLLSNKLKVKQGDEITLVFFQEDSIRGAKPRPRRLNVNGIFETGIDFVDENSVYVATGAISQFIPNGTDFTKIEVWAKSEQLENVGKSINRLAIPAGLLRLNTSKQYHRQIYDWLSILNTNVWIIIILMAIVAVIAVITILLILIFEKISVIGLVQAMGGNIVSIQRVFLWQGLYILFWGILIGDILGIGLCLVQNYFQVIQLNQSIYFISTVELEITILQIVLINFGLLIISMVSGLIPIQWIKKMAPIRAIRYQ